jgi:hypothetical protein
MNVGDEIAILRARLHELKMEKMNIQSRIQGNIRAAKSMLAASSLKPTAEIDIEGASQQLQEAATQKRSLNVILDHIKSIESELV